MKGVRENEEEGGKGPKCITACIKLSKSKEKFRRISSQEKPTNKQ